MCFIRFQYAPLTYDRRASSKHGSERQRRFGSAWLQAMMRHEAKDEEIQNLDAYARQIRSWKRVGSNEAAITTLEGDELRVAISHKGWDVVGSRAEPFATVESLLMSVSPRFREAWNSELHARLQELAHN